jgi:hypothetical protein
MRIFNGLKGEKTLRVPVQLPAYSTGTDTVPLKCIRTEVAAVCFPLFVSSAGGAR